MQTLFNFNVCARHYSCDTLLVLKSTIYISSISKMHSNTQVPTILRRFCDGTIQWMHIKEIHRSNNENI